MANTDGPFEYYSEIHSGVDGNSIRSAAQHPGTNAGVIQALAGELEGDEKKTAGAIEGAIEDGTTANPKAARGTAQDLAAKGTYAVGLLNLFASYVDTFDKTVDSLNSQYNTEVQNSIFGLMHIPEYKTGQEKIDRVAIGKGIEADLRPKYNAALNKLDTDADTIATKFSQGPKPENVRELIRAGLLPLTAATLYPGLVLTNDDQAAYYRSVMADMTATQRAQYLLKHDEIPIAVVNLVLAKDRGTADALGKDIADKVRGLDIDSDGGDVKDVTDLLNRFKGSGEASAAIIQQLGGKDLVKVIAEAGGRVYQGDEDGFALAASLRDVFRSGEPVLEQHDPEAGRTLARDMVQELKDFDDHKLDSNDSLALSYLLRDSTLGTHFLDTMGGELEHMERSNDGFTWSGFGAMQHGGSWLFDEGDREAAFDPMASYMSALGHNDTAALDFFTGHGENPYHVSGSDRQDYWIGHRFWGHDNFDGLMGALDAATSGSDNLDDPTNAHLAADLMSHAVKDLADRSDVDWGRDGEEFKPGDVSDDGTKHLAHMLTTYLPAIDAALENPHDLPPGVQDLTAARFGNGLADMPMFTASDLKGMANVAVSSDEGFDAMRHGLSAYQAIQLQHSISAHGLVDNDTSNADARLEGFFVNAVGDTKIDEAADKDARVQSWIDMGKDLVGEIPVPGGKVVEFLASHAIDSTADSLSEHYADNEDKQVDSSNDYATNALNARHEAVEEALVDAGVIKPSDVAHELTSVPGSTYTKEQVDAWFPGGDFPSKTEYDAMSDSDKVSMRDALNTIVHDRNLQDTTNYDQSYKDMFSEYFEKGDGDGN